MSINCQVPINNLSFGMVSFQILQEFYKKGIDFSLFPIGPLKAESFDSFNKADPKFLKHLEGSANNALKRFSRKDKTLRLWHIGNGSHESVGQDQVLLTFFELDQITETEANILNNQKAVIVTSEEARQTFIQGGVKVPVHYVPLGFDKTYFHKIDRKYGPDEVTTFLISGKFEFRKSTAEVIHCWIKKFGNNPLFKLHINVYNPFISPEDNRRFLDHIYQGKKYFNVIDNIPYVKTLSEVNDVYNSCDIVIDMGNEGWSLPSFHTVGIGKHAVLFNCAGLKSWANNDNSVLVEPNGKVKAVDGIFFSGQGEYNIGNFWKWSQDDFSAALDKAVERKKANKVNLAGLKIPEQFTWDATATKILDILNHA